MVYKTPFLKQLVQADYAQGADGIHGWELSDQPLAAVWLTVKGTLQSSGSRCIDDMLDSITGLDVWFGSFNVAHYVHGIKTLLMNCKLKQAWPYLLCPSSNTTSDYQGVIFPILFGAPYLNSNMCIPASLSNRKRIDITLDDATATFTHTLLDISEVILPDAMPSGCLKQEEVTVPTLGVGEHDKWLQTNWDILKLLLYSPTVADTALTTTIERAGVELNDFPFGYKNVPWEHLHGEMMDELEGSGPVEDHTHTYTSETGAPNELEHWISHYAELDYFFNKDLKWRLPAAGASTCKLKYVEGVAEAWGLVTTYYVPASKI